MIGMRTREKRANLPGQKAIKLNTCRPVMYVMEYVVYMENMYVAWSLTDYTILNYFVCLSM